MILTATAERGAGNGFLRGGKIRVSINVRQFT
jgi:hypothetical protein